MYQLRRVSVALNPVRLEIGTAGGGSGRGPGCGFDRRPKHGEPGGVAAVAAFEPGPEWVPVPIEIAFGVGHEPEDSAGGVADAGDGPFGAIEVFDIPDGDLASGFEIIEHAGVGRDESPLAMGAREHQFVSLEPIAPRSGPYAHAGVWNLDMRPAVHKSPVGVLGEGEGGSGRLVRPLGFNPRQEPELDHDLKAVAGSEHGHASIGCGTQCGPESFAEGHRQNPPGSDVVAVAEPTGEPDHLCPVDPLRVGSENIDMDKIDLAPSHLEPAHHLRVTVRPCRANHQYPDHDRALRSLSHNSRPGRRETV
jgi:hypothetical protein